MENSKPLTPEQYADIMPEATTQFIVRPIHIIITAMLLVAWAVLGTVLIA
jgi:hypothetical protein